MIGDRNSGVEKGEGGLACEECLVAYVTRLNIVQKVSWDRETSDFSTSLMYFFHSDDMMIPVGAPAWVWRWLYVSPPAIHVIPVTRSALPPS